MDEGDGGAAPWVERLPLIGGRPCLDFANTLFWRLRPSPTDALTDYAALVAFCRRAGVLSDAAGSALRRRAIAEPARAGAVVTRARALREAIQELVVGAARGREPDGTALATLNRELAGAMAAAVVTPTGEGFGWGWPEAEDDPDLARPLWPLARSAAELLASPQLRSARQCPGEGCGWVFLDETRGKRRRWCEMATCGNRARVRAFARRSRQAKSSPRADGADAAS